MWSQPARAAQSAVGQPPMGCLARWPVGNAGPNAAMPEMQRWRAARSQTSVLATTIVEVHRMSRSTKLCVALGSIVLPLGCASSDVRYISPYPARWVKQQIRLYEMPTSDAPGSVTRKVIYAGGPAYFIASPCCDKYDYFYDSRGVILCAPSGGFTGRGDGSCDEVFGAASAKDL